MANLYRSPPPNKDRNDRDLVTKEWMREFLSSEFTKMETRINHLEENLNKTLQDKLGAVENRLAEVERCNEALRGQNDDLQKRLLQVERDARQLNVVATGLEFNTPKEGYQKLQDLVCDTVSKDLAIKGVRTFNTSKGKGIVARCESVQDKQDIMRAKKSFDANIFVNDDLTRADRIAQAKLREIARKARQEGKDVRIGLGKIKIDGEWLLLNQNTNELSKHTFRPTIHNTHVECTGPSFKDKGNPQLH